ncbi:MAG: TetR/AcrR family transcriptional regulator [Gemmatimonadetes bacterium]|nr:TetR/AcrR family transcriptional regulator [Gemmatimonadota bacterium]
MIYSNSGTDMRAGTPPGPSVPKRDTRAALLSAARKAFAQNGYDGTSVREITRQAKANLASVSYHFGSKRVLYESVLSEGLAPMVDRVGKVARGSGRPFERLERAIEVYFDFLGANPDLPRLVLQELSAGNRPPAAVIALVRRHAGYLIGILTEGWEDGSLRRTHPFLSALSIVSQPVMMTVVAPLFREVAGIDLRDAKERSAAARHVQDLLREGLSTELASRGEEGA